MVVEAGGKNGVVPADATTAKYLEGKTSKPYQAFNSDGNARYTNTAIYLFLACVLAILDIVHLQCSTLNIAFWLV
jgi:hypothetical protein